MLAFCFVLPQAKRRKPAGPALRTVFMLLWFGFVVLFGAGVWGVGVGEMMMFMSALLCQRPPLAKRLSSEKYHSWYLCVHSSDTVSELTNSKCQHSGWRQSDICPVRQHAYSPCWTLET